MRRIDGAGPVSRLIAAGRSLAGGFDADGGIIITAEDDGAVMQLWDVDADRPLGSSGSSIDWASRDRIVRPGELLAPASGGGEYPIDPQVVAQAGVLDTVVPALPGPTAFVVGDAGLVPFDPLTGEVSTVRIERGGWDLRVVESRKARFDFMDGSRLFPAGSARLDSAFYVESIPYRWRTLERR